MTTKNQPGKDRGISSGWKKAARASAWALLIGMVVLAISGWGITQTGIIYRLSFGLIDRRLANTIHGVTMVPLTIFFLAHVFINAAHVISPRRPWKWVIISLLGIIGAGVMTIVIYLEFFRLGG
jgi:cytochrome b subunit of formate dehydrogenase